MISDRVQSVKGIWRVRKGVCLKKYVYKPYHPWRHGYRREKVHAVFIFFLRMILVAELIILSGRYLKEHTTTLMHDKEITYETGAENVYGIGFEPEKGDWFWFHKKTEVEDE